jgi:hypothetical protein
MTAVYIFHIRHQTGRLPARIHNRKGSLKILFLSGIVVGNWKMVESFPILGFFVFCKEVKLSEETDSKELIQKLTAKS